MSKKAGWLGAGVTLAALATASVLFGAGSAQAAVVYCKTVGVPKGCVVRPTPVAAAAVVATPAVGVARVGVGAPGVGVRPGTPMNRGGPGNRVGRR
jgi:hypothetical protein